MRILPTADRLAHFAMTSRGLASRWIATHSGRVHVYDGKGAGHLPPAVLIHGLSAAGSSFGPLVRRVLPHVKRVIVPELPGHGRSTQNDEGRLTPDDLFDAMTSALDELIDEPVILYGNSLGGAVALTYAIRRPENVRALVLVSPAGARIAEEEWKTLVDAFDLRSRKDAVRFFEKIYHRPPWLLALVAHEFPDLVKRRAVRDILETSTLDHAAKEDDLASLAMPVLLLWGRSDRLLPAQALAWFKQHLPKHAVIEEPAALGHAPQTEDPRRVAARIVAFARSALEVER